jgi:hypothetical protein
LGCLVAAGGPLPAPELLFDAPVLSKIAFGDGQLYGSKASQNALRITENIDFGFELTAGTTSVTEGASPTAAIRLHLTAPPNRPIKVKIERISGDGDIEVIDGSYEFNDKNWRADAYPFDLQNFQALAPALRLEASADVDSVDGQAVIRVSAAGLQPLDIVVEERDKNGELGIELSDNEIALREGHTGSFQVRLTAAPAAPIVITTARTGGDSDFHTEAHEQLTFDATNWDRWQWVSIAANEDSDSTDDIATFTVFGGRLPSRTLQAMGQDVGIGGQRAYDVLIDDYATLPLQGELHEFELYNRLRGNRGKIIGDGGQAGTVGIVRGAVEAHLTAANGFVGLFNSLNHTLSEGQPLNFNALLPAVIKPEYQYHASAIVLKIEDGQGQLKVEVKSPTDDELFSATLDLTGGPATITIPLPELPTNAQALNWLLIGEQG